MLAAFAPRSASTSRSRFLLLLPLALLVAACGTSPGAAVDGGAEPADETAAWRSHLYPADWTPGYHDAEGRFLHDFSWAGYHNGEVAIPDDPPGVRVDVVAQGADNQGGS